MIDAADDEKLNIGNSARYFGRRKEKWVFLLGLAHLFIYFFVGLSVNLDLSFFFFLSLCFGIVFFQNFQINLGLRQIYLSIFKGNNWIGVFLFFGILFGF
jgi:4-hydroxybenzoate polyprenyltransferase